MADLLADLASPALYPMAVDLARGAAFLIRLEEADYRRASFLDERILTPQTRGQWVPFATLERALPAPAQRRPLHFIFHAGHVGSTLLSRLLDETGKVLSLREPLPLRTFAEAYDAGAPDLDARLETLLRLWERGFAGTEAVILKATSAAERLAPRLLAMCGEARAVLLNVSAESYLATMLAGENSAVDLNAHGPERLYRLGKLLGAPAPRPTTLGELAAMSWLTERLAQEDIRRLFGDRILAIDFDRMLQALDVTIGDVVKHFDIAATPELRATIAGSTILSRYSKAPQHAYSPQLRAERLSQARQGYSAEIGAALGWLSNLARHHGSIAAIL